MLKPIALQLFELYPPLVGPSLLQAPDVHFTNFCAFRDGPTPTFVMVLLLSSEWNVKNRISETSQQGRISGDKDCGKEEVCGHICPNKVL